MTLILESDFEAVVAVVQQQVDGVQHKVTYDIFHGLETLQSTQHYPRNTSCKSHYRYFANKTRKSKRYVHPVTSGLQN